MNLELREKSKNWVCRPISQFRPFFAIQRLYLAIFSFFTELQDRISELWDISTELQKNHQNCDINSQLQGKSENLEKKVRIARCKRWDVNVELQEKCLNCENSILRKKVYFWIFWILQFWLFSSILHLYLTIMSFAIMSFFSELQDINAELQK